MPDRSARTSPRTHLTAADLAPRALNHLTEIPSVAAAVARTVDACLTAGRRFPHTVLAGPADSGKRTLANAIAASMCEPVFHLDATTADGMADFHAVFRGCADRAVVVISGFDPMQESMYRTVARASVRQRRQPMPEPSVGDLPGFEEMFRQGPRGARRYADFTIIATMRSVPGPSDGGVRWAERTYFTGRTGASEGIRLGRMLRRAGFAVDAGWMNDLGGLAVRHGIRTIPFANAIAEWLVDSGHRSLEPDTPTTGLAEVIAAMAVPMAAPARAAPATADAASGGPSMEAAPRTVE